MKTMQEPASCWHEMNLAQVYNLFLQIDESVYSLLYELLAWLNIAKA